MQYQALVMTLVVLVGFVGFAEAQTIIADDSPNAYPPIKLQYLLEVHDRFMVNFVDGTTGQILENLWAVTSSICSKDQDVRWIKDEIDRIALATEFNGTRLLIGDAEVDPILVKGHNFF